jgi:hypothetical protein
MRFNFADVTRDSVQLDQLRSELGRYHLKEDQKRLDMPGTVIVFFWVPLWI